MRARFKPASMVEGWAPAEIRGVVTPVPLFDATDPIMLEIGEKKFMADPVVWQASILPVIKEKVKAQQPVTFHLEGCPGVVIVKPPYKELSFLKEAK